MKHTVTLQYEAMGFTHIRITPLMQGLKVEWGEVATDNRRGYPDVRFMAFHVEVFKYKDNPELYDIHDHVGWNVEDLFLFVASLCPEVG